MGIERYTILKSSVEAVLKALLISGKNVVAPVQKEDGVYFEKIDEVSTISNDYIQTKVSLKSFAFPRYEKLFGFRKSKGTVTVEDNDYEKIP
jgi:hypothetical protein